MVQSHSVIVAQYNNGLNKRKYLSQSQPRQNQLKRKRDNKMQMFLLLHKSFKLKSQKNKGRLKLNMSQLFSKLIKKSKFKTFLLQKVQCVIKIGLSLKLTRKRTSLNHCHINGSRNLLVLIKIMLNPNQSQKFLISYNRFLNGCMGKEIKAIGEFILVKSKLFTLKLWISKRGFRHFKQ